MGFFDTFTQEVRFANDPPCDLACGAFFKAGKSWFSVFMSTIKYVLLMKGRKHGHLKPKSDPKEKAIL